MTSISSSSKGAQTQFNLQTTPCRSLAFVHVHHIVPPWTVVTTSSCGLLLIYWPWKDERVSWASWLTYSRRFNHRYEDWSQKLVPGRPNGENSMILGSLVLMH